MYNMAYINIKQIQLKDESLGEINEIKSWSFFYHSFFHLPSAALVPRCV